MLKGWKPTLSEHRRARSGSLGRDIIGNGRLGLIIPPANPPELCANLVPGPIGFAPYDLGQCQNRGIKIVRTNVQGDQGAFLEVISRLESYPASADF